MSNKKKSFDEIKSKSSKRSWINTTTFVVLVILVVISGFFALATSIGANNSASEVEEVEKISRSLSGKTLAEDRVDATQAVYDLLSASNAPATVEEARESISSLESGDFSGLDESFMERIRFYDSYASNDDFKKESAMAVYSLASVAKEAAGGELAFDSSRLGIVRVDQETGIAQVPIELFIGQSSPVAFQMVFHNGEWLLEPHSLSTYIRLSASSL